MQAAKPLRGRRWAHGTTEDRLPGELAAALESGGPLRELLSRGMGAIIALTRARGGAVRLILHNDGRLRLVCSAGLPPGLLAGDADVMVQCGLCGQALLHDMLQLKATPTSCTAGMSAALAEAGLGPMLAVPLHCQGRPVGVFNLFFDDCTALPADLSAILTPVTELLDLVLESAQHEHGRLQARLLTERQGFANEVHDALAQNLSYMRMRMSLLNDAIADGERERATKYCRDVNESLGETHAGLRELITHFRQTTDPLGLLHALENTARTFEDRTGVALRIENRIPDLRLPAEHEAQLIHIVQEALANVVKHAGARNASIVIEPREGGLTLSVIDDGRGKPPGETGPAEHDGHFGLAIMRERARRIGARLRILGRAGKGTRVRLDIPAAARIAP